MRLPVGGSDNPDSPAMPKGQTFVSLFDKARTSNPDDECYISYSGDMTRQSISFQELWTLASRFAHILKQRGLDRGDYVVVATPSSLEYVVASFGVVFAGGVLVPMEKLFPNCQVLKKTIKMTKAKFLIMTDSAENGTWPFFQPNATEEGGPSNVTEQDQADHSSFVVGYHDKSLPSLKKIVFTNNTSGPHSPRRAFLTQLRAYRNEFREHALDPEDGCICPSSVNQDLATPKLVELSHRAVVNMSALYQRFSYVIGKTHMKWPWYISVTLPYDALNGVARIIPDTFSPMSIGFSQHFLKIVDLEGIHGAIMSPDGIRSLAQVWSDPGNNTLLLKELMLGGQPVTAAVIQTARQIASNIHVLYMVSETNFVSTNQLTPGDAFDPFDCGHPLDGVEVKILDESNQELPCGETGHIAIRSPYLFTRYPGQPALTKSVMDKDGWFYSNDAGYISADGRLHVYGRRGDAISRGITLIYPPWIEKTIMDIPDVMRVTAVGVPDQHNFQNTCACVTIRPGSDLTEDDIHRIYDDSVGGGGAAEAFPLDHVIIFDGALPKMTRQELGELAAEKLREKSQ